MENTAINLFDIIVINFIFFQRLDVQIQLLAIIFCLTMGWLVSKKLWHWLQKKNPKITTFSWGDKQLSINEYLALLLQHIDFPLISIILLELMKVIFNFLGLTKGLIILSIYLVIFYLIYRCLLALLYGTFPITIIQECHWQLFNPLFILFILVIIIKFCSDLDNILQAPFISLFNNTITFGTIFTVIAGLYFWSVTIIFLERLFLNITKNKNPVERGTIQATLLLFRYFFIALGIVIILGYVGVNGNAVAAISGGLSVGIGFGLKEVFSNFISGILLLFEKVLKPGDIISIEGQTCEVKELGIRATTVKILTDNSEKIIPNQSFFTQDVTTYTGSSNLVYCSLLIGVGYNSNAEQVINLLLEIAYNDLRILKNPSPVAFFLNFGDSSLNFELKFWLDDINIKKRVISNLNCSILSEFSKYNIEIPFPQTDIHIRNN